MRNLVRIGAVCGAVLLAVPAGAQQAGTIELGGFYRRSYFDKNLNLDPTANSFPSWNGLGARAGIFVLPRWEIEGDYSWTTATAGPGVTRYEYRPLHVRLVYNQPLGQQFQGLLGAGYTRNSYGKGWGTAPNPLDFNVDDWSARNDNGIGGLAGVRFIANDWLGVRLDGTMDYMSSPFNKGPGISKEINWGIQAGVSILLFHHLKSEQVEVVQPPPPPAPAPVAAPAPTPAPPPPPPPDADNDGVPDSLDKCPNTPAGVKVDANGCPVDSDGDGVPDYLDKCPNTAAGTKVDTNGCPVLFEEKKTAVVLKGVNFEFNKSTLLPEATTVLDDVAASLVANPEIRVEVAGYTDNVGNAAYNRKLSQARADAVKTYLVGKGVSADRLESKGYGDANPVASNRTKAGQAQNRRVELHKLS